MAQQITIDIVADIKKLQQGVETANQQLSGLQSSVNNVQKLQGAFAGVATSAAALAPVAAFISGTTEAASDLNETVAKTGEIFGDGLAAVEEFAEAAAVNIGQSKQQALDAASTFGIFGRAANLSGEDLVKFSTDFTVLASDLASFNNTTPEEAINALGAALRGESEPLRRYGVLLSADAVAAEAAALGITNFTVDTVKLKEAQIKAEKELSKYNEVLEKYGPNSKEAAEQAVKLEKAEGNLAKASEGTAEKLTAEQKILATQSIIYRQTETAQGDFARTSEGLANQQRTLQAEQENLNAEIGELFLPIVKEVIGVVREVIGFFKNLSPEVRNVIIVVGLLAVTLGPLVILFNSSITLVKTLSGMFGIFTAATKAGTIATTAATVATNLLRFAMIALPIVAIIGLIVLLVANWDTVVKVVGDVVKAIVDFGKKALQAIGDFIGSAAKSFGNFLKDVGNFVKKVIDFFLDIPKNMLNIGKNIVEGLWNGISGMVNWFRDKILGFFGGLLPGWVKDVLGIKSPSKVFEGIGKNIVQGTTRGLVVPRINTSSLGIAGQGRVNITINAGLGTDPYALGRVVTSAINKQGKVSNTRIVRR